MKPAPKPACAIRASKVSDLSRDVSADAMFRRDGQSAKKAVGERDGDAGDLNIDIFEIENNPSETVNGQTIVEPEKANAVLEDLRTRLNKLMIRNVDLRFDPDMKEQGATEIDRNGEISVLIGAAVNDMNTLNHEAIHVLRTRKLFTEKEWSALEAEARKTWMNDHDIAKRYGDLDEAAGDWYRDNLVGRTAVTKNGGMWRSQTEVAGSQRTPRPMNF